MRFLFAAVISAMGIIVTAVAGILLQAVDASYFWVLIIIVMGSIVTCFACEGALKI